MRRSATIRPGGALAVAVLAAVALATAAGAATAPQLDDALKRKLDENYRLCLSKKKGPYSQNYCVCANGTKDAVQKKDGRIVTPCGGRIRFCAAFREPWADALADERMYVANLFARDLFLWDEFPDHNDLVRGYILEKFLLETNPTHKFSQQ